MPTDRFYRLAETKKQAIRDAAIKEFASVAYEKVSINKIIQNANISRGSFYTYFEDKQDVLNFIFEDVHDQCNQFFKDTLQQNRGDYFDTMEKFFDYCLEIFENTKLLELAKNVFLFYRGSEIFFYTEPWDEKRSAAFEHIKQLIDMEKMRITKTEEFQELISLSMANLAIALKDFYWGECDRTDLYSRYRNGLELLKYGALSAEQGSLHI